ncbi:hypothetical protein Scep_006564 [Stephania cephalantha]|uniref:Thaumatin-like protein n=1 Tax=Stephania cephalantha TaxID=152367 RepID=A0AAP0K8E5_9MAGN
MHLFLLSSLLFAFANAANFDVVNNCPFTVWAAASPGGGRQLDQGQTWSFNRLRTAYALNQFNNMDFFDISLVDGFNVPIDFSPTGGGCRGIRCAADINGQCPGDLRAPGGCNNPCTVYKTDQYCCTGSASNNCPPTDKSRFFKDRCPDAYSYPKDDQTSTFTCPGGTNYRVVFCP